MPEMKEFLPNISRDDAVKVSYDRPKHLPRYESATVLPIQSDKIILPSTNSI